MSRLVPLLVSLLVPLVAMGVLRDPVVQERVSRRYDVAPLVQDQGWDRLSFDLWPWPARYEEELLGSEPERRGITTAYELDRLIRSLLGKTVDVDSDWDAVDVTATPAQHAEIEQLLRAMTGAMGGGLELEVRMLVGFANADAPVMRPRVESDRLEQELVRSGRASLEHAGSASLVDGYTTSLLQQSSHTETTIWNLEISHSAVVYSPVMEPHHAGLRAKVRSARIPGGARLDLALMYKVPAAAPRRRTLKPKVWYVSSLPHEMDYLGSEDRKEFLARLGKVSPILFHDVVPLDTDFPLDRFVSMATSILLPADQAAWIPVQVESAGGTMAATLVLRLNGSPRPVVTSLPAPAGRERVLVHRAAVEQGGFLPKDSGDDPHPFLRGDLGPIERIRRAAGAAWSLGDRLKRDLEQRPHQDPPTAVSLNDDVLILEADAAPGPSVADLAARRFDVGRSATICGRVLNGDLTLAEFHVPATVGRTATIWAGFMGRHLADWDADVANQAGGATPWLQPFFDGLALDLDLIELPSQRVLLSVAGALHPLQGLPVPEAIGPPSTPELEPVSARRLELDERVVVPLEKGRGRVWLGGSPLALEIEVVLASQDPSPGVADPPDERVHALPAVAVNWGQRFDGMYLSRLYKGEQEISGDVDWMDTDALVDAIKDYVAARVPDADPDFTVEEVTRLRVIGSTAVHDCVAQLLQELDRASASPQRIEVRLLRGREDPPGARFLPIEEADRRIVAAGGPALVRQASTALAERLDVYCRQLVERDVVQDFEVEIAHGAVLYDPIVVRATDGLAACFTAARTPTGTLLDWVVRTTEPLPPWQIRPRPRPLLASPFPEAAIMIEDEQPLHLDLQPRMLWSGAGSVELPTGHALWLPCRVATQSGECAFTLDVRVVGERGPDPTVTLTPTASSRASGFGIRGVEENALLVDWWPDDIEDARWPSFVFLSRHDWDDDPLTIVPADHVVEPPRSHYQVLARVTQGEVTVAELSTITLPDRGATLWAGAVAHFLREWDIDAAGEARIGNPMLAPYLDGLFLGVHIREQAEDGLSLLVLGAIHHLTEPPRAVEFGNPDSPLIQQLHADRLIIDRNLELDLVDGECTVTLPGAPLAVELTIRRLPARRTP